MGCMKNWTPGNPCSCGCFYLDRDWWTQHKDPIPDPEPADWLGDTKLDVLGDAYYDEHAASGDTGMLVLPASGSGVLLNQPSPFIDRGFVLGDLLTSTVDGFVTALQIPYGTKIRLFFEADLAMENYIYADCEFLASTGPAYASTGDYWIISLGQRVSGSDTGWDTWAMVTQGLGWKQRDGAAPGDHSAQVLNCHLVRQMCQSITISDGLGPVDRPPGCIEGYGAHARLIDFHSFDLSRARNWISPVSEAYYADAFKSPSESAYPGASIEAATTPPPATYCGAVRLDDNAAGTGEIIPALLRFAVGRVTATLDEDGCLKTAFSIHNLCKDTTPRSLRFTVENAQGGIRVGQEPNVSPRYSPISKSYTVNHEYTSGGDYDADGWSTGDLIERYAFTLAIRLNSSRTGETELLSRGEDTPTLSIVATLVQHGPCRDGFGTLYVEEKWQYEWDIEIALATREIDCASYTFSLDPADATITELNIGLTPEPEAEQMTAPVEIDLV